MGFALACQGHHIADNNHGRGANITLLRQSRDGGEAAKCYPLVWKRPSLNDSNRLVSPATVGDKLGSDLSQPAYPHQEKKRAV